MNIISINEAFQLINQLVDEFEEDKTKSSVEGIIILNRDNGFFPTALKMRLETSKNNNEEIILYYLYLALNGTKITCLKHATKSSKFEDLKNSCSNIEDFELWLTKPISKGGEAVLFEFSEEGLIANQEFERPSDVEVTNYLNELFESIPTSGKEDADLQLLDKAMKKFVSDEKAIKVGYNSTDNAELVNTNVNERQNTTTKPLQMTTQTKKDGLDNLVVAVGVVGVVFSIGIAVGMTLPFIGAAKLCRKIFR